MIIILLPSRAVNFMYGWLCAVKGRGCPAGICPVPFFIRILKVNSIFSGIVGCMCRGCSMRNILRHFNVRSRIPMLDSYNLPDYIYSAVCHT
jgi:hypothetical protein